MGSQKWTDVRFGKRVRALRQNRRWSQAEMAKMLSDRGIQPMYATTVSKIEVGHRSVRINEAVGIADLFEITLDSLLGRKPGAQGSDLTDRLVALASCANESYLMTTTLMRTIYEPLEQLPSEFEGADNLREMGNSTLTRLESARMALAELASQTGEIMLREHARIGEAQS
jgi:transcriptional regulator with XRE-family HTH domain